MTWGCRCLWAYAQAHTQPDRSTAQMRASWNETGVNRLPPQLRHHRYRQATSTRRHQPHHTIGTSHSGEIITVQMKTTSKAGRGPSVRVRGRVCAV
jgi:hypothetical protein